MAGLVVESLPQDAEHRAEIAELYEARGDGESQPGGDQAIDQDVAHNTSFMKSSMTISLGSRSLAELSAGMRPFEIERRCRAARYLADLDQP
jgi:hypothetical protein